LIHPPDQRDHRTDLWHEHRVARLQPDVSFLVSAQQEVVEIDLGERPVVAKELDPP
jgi:hypothetical protein